MKNDTQVSEFSMKYLSVIVKACVMPSIKNSHYISKSLCFFFPALQITLMRRMKNSPLRMMGRVASCTTVIVSNPASLMALSDKGDNGN